MLRRLFALSVLALLPVLSATLNAQAGDEKPLKILYFTKSTRFEHTVVKQEGGKPSFSENVLNELGKKHNFTITTTKDGGAINAENIAKYDIVMFYTSGELLKPVSKDGSPPMTAEGKAALLEAVKNGKPFIALHNALKTFDEAKEFYKDPWFEMLGGAGIGHGAQQKARNTLVDAKFPGTDGITGGSFEMMEEWYTMREFAKDIHVILVQETSGMQGGLYLRPPFPATWARMYGKGRVFVTSMGHREDVWSSELFQKLLVGGINWAGGRVEADLTPNIEQVAPKYAELHPETKKK